MDFIERIFGVSPDGGSGSLEVALTLVPFLIFIILTRLMRSRRSLPGESLLHCAHTSSYSFADVGRHTIHADNKEIWAEDGR
jgi:hypothetical protein